MTVSQLAELSKLSKSYISKVKSGNRPPSDTLIKALNEYHAKTTEGRRETESLRAINLFLTSRREGTSQSTLDFYRKYLTKSIPILGLTPSARQCYKYLDSLSCTTGGKHAYFRAISVFFNWLYSPKSGYNLKMSDNPVALVDPPKRPRLILPSLTKEEVGILLDNVEWTRDKAIIALFTESGLRLSELVNLKRSDIDWVNQTVKVIGKGNKEGYAPFGGLSKQHLREWIAEYKPGPREPVWDIGFWGIKSMLHNLSKQTGLACNPHTFRRTFACLLRKAGVDTMTIKDLGRWESLEMVQRYTRSVTFHDSLKLYKAPLS